ncbi:MAG: phosphatidylglycerophosphatase A [Rickettsiaceae bacterium H1]|nr:phosphatidylglycerophosphatase A [Rickettsiaceae bacterium H1]
MSNSIKKNIVIFISTCFNLGFFCWAPGTLGSLAALPFLPVILFCNGILSVAFLLIVFVLGLWAADRYSTKNDDPKEVVIDEFVGMLFTFYIVQLFVKINLIVTIISFFAFRIFDVIKPWPVSFFDKKVKGGLGIMLDDVMAAIMAGLSVSAVINFIL